MPKTVARTIACAGIIVLSALLAPGARAEVQPAIFNVKNFGATGKKADNAQKAIQAAMDACAKSGGGEVYLPAGDYASGNPSILHSRVTSLRLPRAPFFSRPTMTPFTTSPHCSMAKTFQDVTIQGRGTIDGPGRVHFQAQ